MAVEIIKIEMVHEGWARFRIATIRLPDGTTMRREIEDHGRSVCVLAYDPVRKTALLVRQFRAPVYFAGQPQETLEAVAGIVEDGEPADCARREALEEAGLKLGTLDHIMTGWTMPGISTERMDFYLSVYRAADRVAAGGGRADEHERLTVVEFPLARLAAMADAGELTDVKTFALLQTLRLRRPDLFAA
jgi:nudix-type nucleoside diphosphatase (YffH/AdpP family)